MAMQTRKAATTNRTRQTLRFWKMTLWIGLVGVGCGSRDPKPKSASPIVTTQPTSTIVLPTSVQFAAGSLGFNRFSSETIRHSAMQYPPDKAGDRAAPISLTADDGTGLLLESLDARAIVEGPLAFTELHLRFRNPQSRVLEGRFQITLPEGATVSRLAMKLEKGWQEAEMVERMAARRAYEDFLHRKQDPMLLEKEAGNQFRARIFPIPANGTKEVIISYSHELSSDIGYRLPLRGLPLVKDLHVSVLVAEPDGKAIRYEPHQFSLKGSVPTQDFQVAVQPSVHALRHGRSVVARIVPTMAVQPQRLAGLTILFDTSASRAPGFSGQVRRLGSLVHAITKEQGTSLPIQIAAFDQEVSPIYAGAAGDFGQEHLAMLMARRPLGASNLAKALRWVGEQPNASRLLVISDVMTTAGEDHLAAIAKELPKNLSRIDVLMVGGIRDSDAAARLVRDSGRNDGVIMSAEMNDTEISRRLGDGTTSLTLRVPGASWVWPETVHGVQPGDEFVVYSKFPEGTSAPSTLRIDVTGGDRISLQAATTPGPLLQRSAVQAQITRLEGRYIEESDEDKKRAIRETTIALSTKHRVLSDHTALLVLESDADYKRFGISRNALADIMTVGTSGLVVQQRNQWVSAPKIAVKKNNLLDDDDDDDDSEASGTGPRELQHSGNIANLNSPADVSSGLDDSHVYGGLVGNEVGEMAGGWGYGLSGVGPGGGGKGWGTIGTGNYGTIGHGSGEGSGYGTGSGYGRGAMRPRPPQVELGRAEVRGSIHKDIIRRYVRRKLARLRYCYERELLSTPQLEGTVVARFTIAATGNVARVQATGINNQRVETCIATTIGTIQFPRPQGGGQVNIVYPLTFRPSSNPSAPSVRVESPPAQPQVPKNEGPPALTGTMAAIHQMITSGQVERAVSRALVWRNEDPGNVMALIALGEALEAAKQDKLAARAYGSIIDLFPSRADLRRFASSRLTGLNGHGNSLSVDSLQKAAEQRPDHLSVHRLLAYALVRDGNLSEAFSALETGISRNYPNGRFRAGKRILREDLGIVAMAWIAKDSSRENDIMSRLTEAGSTLATTPSLRFVLNWETDANDVDFHIYDGKGNHAFYSHKQLASGGTLYADVTTGYGPECFAIDGKATAYPYKLQIHYYSRGPMGYGMGQVEILQHDGKGKLSIENRPFVVMNDEAYVELGTIDTLLVKRNELRF